MKLFQHIKGPKTVVVIYVQINKDQKQYYAVLSNSKNKIAANKLELFDSIDEIVASYGVSKAYWLHINGSGVLTRLIDRTSGFKDDVIINGNKDEFWFSSYSDGEKSLVSFVRKTVLEEIETQLQKLKTHFIGISCGNIPVLQLLGENESVDTDFHISKKNNLISDFSRNEKASENIVFRNEFISEKQLIAAAISEYLVHPVDGFEFAWTPEQTDLAISEYKQHRRFSILGVSSVIGILLIVVSNFFYINHLNDQVAQLEADIFLGNDNLSLLDRLEQEKIRKEQLIETSGYLGNKFISFYLDNIGISVPASINLKNMYVFPLEEKLKEKRKVAVNTQKIEIFGITGSSVVFDDWIEKMNRFEWIQSVEVMNYTKINDSQAEFKLILLLSK